MNATRYSYTRCTPHANDDECLDSAPPRVTHMWRACVCVRVSGSCCTIRTAYMHTLIHTYAHIHRSNLENNNAHGLCCQQACMHAHSKLRRRCYRFMRDVRSYLSLSILGAILLSVPCTYVHTCECVCVHEPHSARYANIFFLCVHVIQTHKYALCCCAAAAAVGRALNTE